MIQQEQNDVGMEDALMDSQANAFMEKAKKPIVWCRLPFGVRIEDLHQSYYEEVIDLVKRHYVPDEPTFTSVKMSQDEASMDEFLSLCNVWIRDTCSMVAVEEGEKKAVGALIGRVYIKKEMNREFARVSPEFEYMSPPPTEKRMSTAKAADRPGSKKSIRRPSSKKSIRRQSSKKSIRRQSSKKSIRRQSAKKSIRRQSTKGKHGPKAGKKKHSSRKDNASITSDTNKVKRVYTFQRPHDLIPKPKKKWSPVTVFYDEDLIYKTEPLRKVQTLKHFISKKFDVFQSLCKKKYYKIYMVVVHRDYRRRGIGKSLMRCVFGMCRGFRIEVAAGVFPSFISQNMFFKLGGKVGYEMAYEDYVVDGSVVFSSTGDLNYSLALMYLIIPPKDEGVYAEKVEDRPPVPRRKDLQFVSESKTAKS
ncbi:uncharacterized protein LOC106670796 [Cimex lectularius]|uniref:N-acetyltransferase domain-containing protein n=1 Tax=Cimex lectularius TaxID=79782 RepID=A0A8I6S2D8_CIMLE|nr:uncharacterized protein LOC106670796 [Cimex lectularius]